ncbi:hypothetical protein ACLOJK_012298 [Asimina triloba]
MAQALFGLISSGKLRINAQHWQKLLAQISGKKSHQASLMIPGSDQSKHELVSSDEVELVALNFNQDHGCFTAGTSCGFRVYCCDPFREAFRREARGVGFRIVQMLFRCHLLALVGDGTNPHYPPNKVFVWDDRKNCAIADFSFRSQVCGVKLRQNFMAVIVEHRILLYKLENPRLFYQMDTLANPRGLCCLSQDSNDFVLACPGLHQGQVRIEHFGLNVAMLIYAHESQIACLTLTLDGLLLATASTKGTLIRIFCTMGGTCLQECLASKVLSMYSSSEFKRLGRDQQTCPEKTKGLLIAAHRFMIANLGKLIPTEDLPWLLPKYFSYQWSFAQFHLPEDTHYVAAFGVQNSVVILGMNGSFDPEKGGEMLQLEYIQFMKIKMEQRPLKDG